MLWKIVAVTELPSWTTCQEPNSVEAAKCFDQKGIRIAKIMLKQKTVWTVSTFILCFYDTCSQNPAVCRCPCWTLSVGRSGKLTNSSSVCSPIIISLDDVFEKWPAKFQGERKRLQLSGRLIVLNGIMGSVPLPSHLPISILPLSTWFSHHRLFADLFFPTSPSTPLVLLLPMSYIPSFFPLSASPEWALNFDIKKERRKKKEVV